MRGSLFSLFGFVSLAVALSDNENIDPALDLNTLGNNTLFTRWRPQYHVMPPSGWSNDPSGPMYDPTTDSYFLSYQVNPNHVDWGNIAWGTATSKDLVTWKDIGGWRNDEFVTLATGSEDSQDYLGVYSGTAQPVNMQGEQNGTLLAFYTSVKKLPTTWQLPYINGTETQSLAYSNDGGLTWEKYDNNPVIESPPWSVEFLTAWRDPFFEPWPSMDAILEYTEPHYYVLLAGGIKAVGPRLPFYSAPASDLTNWTFLGSLTEYGTNFTFGEWSGPNGFSYEVSGTFSMIEKTENGGDNLSEHFFTMQGTEGASSTFRPDGHSSIWELGSMTRRDNGSAAFEVTAGGWVDHGGLYALMSFNDTKNDRRVVWGWSPEDNGGYGTKAVGYQGSLALPRELFVHVAHDVVDVNGILATGNWITSPSVTNNGTFTVKTMGIRPLPDVVAGIQANATTHTFPNVTSTTGFLTPLSSSNSTSTPIASAHYELKFTLRNTSGVAGFAIRSTPDAVERTLITWDPENYTIAVDRSQSTLITRFWRGMARGRFLPYTTRAATNTSSSSSTDVEEVLNFSVFVDGSILEVYVNERFALTTRVYPSRADALHVAPYAQEGGSTVYENVAVVVGGLATIFPERPVNSSSALVYDTDVQTGNRTWWSGT